ncbi:hypothetical protein LT493_08880 [Streptomyces tricolor]|nr:hypothetical protein [Streptomyces tricolor]
MHGGRQVAAGCYHSMLLTEDKKVMTWGDNSKGQLGTGKEDTSDHNTPVPVPGLTDVEGDRRRLQLQPGQEDRRHGLGVGRQLQGPAGRQQEQHRPREQPHAGAGRGPSRGPVGPDRPVRPDGSRPGSGSGAAAHRRRLRPRVRPLLRQQGLRVGQQRERTARRRDHDQPDQRTRSRQPAVGGGDLGR